MLRGFLIVLSLALANFTFAQNEMEKTWFWQISGGDLQGKSYLFGTLPVKDSTFFVFPDKLFKNLDKSDVFIYLEDDPSRNAAYLEHHKAAFGSLNRDFGATPIQYLRSIATEKLKPTVALKQENNFQKHIRSSSPQNASNEYLRYLKESYWGADMAVFAETRTALDVPNEVGQKISSQYNYQIINELINQMRLQPGFIAIDAIYLTGQEGLVSLLRARGYKVKPLEEKTFAKKAKEIEQMKLAQQAWEAANNPPQQPIVTPPSVPTNEPSATISAPDQATQAVKLDLPIGILNLSQWSNYELKDGSYQYDAPQRLKSIQEGGNVFQTSYGDIDYQIALEERWDDTKARIEQLMINNGGQVVSKKNYQKNGVYGELVELMYAENQISKHLLLQGVGNNVIVSVKGSVPEIHSLVADQFLHSFWLEQVPESIEVKKPSGAQEQPETLTPQWKYSSLQGMNFSFPAKQQIEKATTEDGTTVNAVLSSKSIDKNTYLLVANSKQNFDNFKLFNTSINNAAEEIRGVIVERNVLPMGRDNFAEYLMKDAVDNYYRIQYYYQNNTFYQLIIKGDKKSVYNSNAERVVQSIMF